MNINGGMMNAKFHKYCIVLGHRFYTQYFVNICDYQCTRWTRGRDSSTRAVQWFIYLRMLLWMWHKPSKTQVLNATLFLNMANSLGRYCKTRLLRICCYRSCIQFKFDRWPLDCKQGTKVLRIIFRRNIMNICGKLFLHDDRKNYKEKTYYGLFDTIWVTLFF